MRTAKNISITMPPTMLKEVEQMAKKEHRTISELVREALRRYQQQRRWDKINAYGRTRAGKLGIRKADVVPLIREFRKEKTARKQAAG